MQLADIQNEFEAELAGVSTPAAVAELRVKYLGRNGVLAGLRKGVDFGALAPDERRSFGQRFNDLKEHLEEALERAAGALDGGAGPAPAADFDLTLPGLSRHLGAIHPIASTQVEVEDVFRSMGFRVYTGDEAVSEFENFDALNIPGDHPARDMQDTFWLENGMVLRTHTSAMQNRAMRELGVPLRAIFPGRCFRNEAADLTHENTFYQLEGLMIDRGVSVANLIAVMRELLAHIFPGEIEVRLRPGYFPFVEPGFELDFRSSVTGRARWIELIPCGMVHPAVLRNGGVDPDEFSGFAFGLGLTRLAMLKHGIPDVRLFNRGDLRFYEQFTATL
jgi:phenylalanyl-tRNA synthetase alpha chain